MKTLIAAISLAVCSVSIAQTNTNNEELERRINILAEEIAQLKASQQNVGTGQTAYGLGQAASKVYFNPQGLSIGGYGEIVYNNQASEDESENSVDNDPTAEALRNVIYLGYKYNDKWIMNTEIEIEHVNETFTEFMYIDYLNSETVNYRFGLNLIPMGITNELHEPIYFNSVKRSEIEKYLIPSTWRELGVGAFGSIGNWDYKAFIFNGPDADGIAGNVSNGIRGGRKKGGVKDNASTAVVVANANYRFDTSNSLGMSLMQGSASSDNDGDDLINLDLRVTEIHGQFKWSQVGVTFLLARVNFLNSSDWNDQSSNKLPEIMSGGYLEFDYDIELKKAAVLTPFIRVEKYDLNKEFDSSDYGAKDESLDRENLLVGLSYKPIDRIVFKADHTWKKNGAETGINEFNLGLGFLY